MDIQHPRTTVDIFITERDWQLSEGNFQKALLRSLQRAENTQWRIVCANIIVECSEPYRTLVLSRKVLENLREQQSQHRQMMTNMSTHNPDKMLQFTAEMHMPLVKDAYAQASLESADSKAPS